jgi:hypothetical protein
VTKRGDALRKIKPDGYAFTLYLFGEIIKEDLKNMNKEEKTKTVVIGENSENTARK